MKTPALCCFCNSPSLTLGYGCWGLRAPSVKQSGDEQYAKVLYWNHKYIVTLKASHMYYLFLIPAAWSSFWFQSVSLVWWDGKALELPRIGTCLRTAAKPNPQQSEPCPRLFWIAQSVGDVLASTIHPCCKYSTHEYSVFSFKCHQIGAWGGLFLTQIYAFTKSIQFKQTVTALVSVLFSWQAFQNSSKPDLLAAKPYSNLN